MSAIGPGRNRGVGGDEILDPVGLHLQQQVAHALGLELERARRIGAGEDVENPPVGEIDVVEIERVATLGGHRERPPRWLPAEASRARVGGSAR